LKSEIAPQQGREKPTLLDLRERYGLSIVQLADMSRVKPSIVYCMLLCRPVKRTEARRVLRNFSKMIGEKYALDDITVVLSEDMRNCSGR
jgi:hypothetical protein